MKETDLISIWIEQKAEMLRDPDRSLKWTKKANGAGEYFLAVEIAESFLQSFVALEAKTRLTFQQQLALALARAGFIQRARTVLEQIRAAGAEDGETLGLFGSIYKSLSGKSTIPQEKTTLLQTSRDYYRLGFAKARDTYCGINAATLSLLLDEPDTAKKIAEETRKAVPRNDDYWDLATLAEATLLEGNLNEARAGYKLACDAAGGQWANIASTRKQCRLISQKMNLRPDFFDDCFPAGAIGFFAGHMIDAPDRATPRFPSAAIPSVAERIAAWLKNNSIRFTYSSAACGGDILFLEAAQAQGAVTNILLPFASKFFIETSVAHGGEDWVRRFEAVVQKAASLSVLNEDEPDFHASSYDFTNRLISARAAARSAVYDLPVGALVVWDGKVGDAYGGTADGIAYWAKSRVRIDVLNPTNPALDDKYDISQRPPEVPFPRIYTAHPDTVQTEVSTLLHLNLPGYENMREKDFALFVQKWLGPLADKMVEKGWFPARYGFGAHYLFAWKRTLEAGLAALAFQSLFQKGSAELSAPMKFKLCLHTAPLQMMVNPLLNQYTHEGAGMARLRALVELLEPGLVYATEPFANFTSFEKIRDFACDYSGTVGASATSSGTRVYLVSP